MAADGAMVEPLDEAERDRRRPAARGRRHRGGRHLPHQQLSQSAYTSSAPRRSCVQRFPDLLVTASYAVLPEMQGIRAHQHDRGECLPAGGDAQLSAEARRRACARIGVAAPIRVMTSNGGMLAAATACEKPVFVVASGPAGGVIGAARLGRGARRARSHRVRHGRHDGQGRHHRGRPAEHDVRVRVPRRHLDVQPLRQGRRLHAQGAGHRYRRGRRRRRLARRHRQGRAAHVSGRESAGAVPGPGLLRPRQRPADRHRCQRRARADQPDVAGRRPAADRPAARASRRSRHTSPSRSGYRSRMPRTASARSPTPPWRARSAPSRSSAAAIRAI